MILARTAGDGDVVGQGSRQSDGYRAGALRLGLALRALGQMRLYLAGLGLRQGAKRPGVDVGPKFLVSH